MVFSRARTTPGGGRSAIVTVLSRQSPTTTHSHVKCLCFSFRASFFLSFLLSHSHAANLSIFHEFEVQPRHHFFPTSALWGSVIVRRTRKLFLSRFLHFPVTIFIFFLYLSRNGTPTQAPHCTLIVKKFRMAKGGPFVCLYSRPSIVARDPTHRDERNKKKKL